MSTIDSIDYDNMQVTLLDVDMAENIHEKMPKMQLQDSQLSYVEVPMTHTVDGSHYDTLATYFIVTYRTNDKWYLYDVNQDLIYVNFGTDPDGNPVDPYEAMGLFNSSFIGGDKDIGYIPLDSTWTAYDPGVSEFISEIGEVVSQQHYMQDTENAAIHMLRLRTDTTAEELAAHLWENLSHTDGITEENETVTIANCNAFCTKYFNETLGIYFISYILEAPDGDIRYLSIEATEDYLSAYLYLLALVLPQNNT
jgi:hypothetical protein